MTNSAVFTKHDLVTLAGSAADQLADDLLCCGVSTDSRTVVAGNLFVALVGERFDGHDHVESAFERGAVAAVVNPERYVNFDTTIRARCIPANDTLVALGALARYHRSRFSIPVLAIAGAAGKTSTKELVAHVLSTTYTVLKTEANYNNRIGTPLTLLALTDEHTAAVLEIGTNEPGEIEALASMVRPTHGLITNIEKEHLEKLIDLDGVEKEETALFDFLRDFDGLALVNADDDRLRPYAQRQKSISFGVNEAADITLRVEFDDNLHPTLFVLHDVLTMRAPLQTVGLAAARNAACAVAAGYAMNVRTADIRAALMSYTPPEAHGYARMVVQRFGSWTILNDTYNANPASMLIALETLARFSAQRRIAVLGDMRELGTTAQEEHLDVLKKAIALCDRVHVIGDEFTRAAVNTTAVVHTNHADCVAALEADHHINDVVLVKGSRGLTMENIVTTLANHHSTPVH